MIKPWLITASAPICGTDTYYRAYSEENPELSEDWSYVFDLIVEDLWNEYSWGLHLEDEEYESEDEEYQAREQAYEDWRCDCSISVDEATEEDLENVAPGGNIDNIEIVYDER